MVALMSPEDSWVGRWQRIGTWHHCYTWHCTWHHCYIVSLLMWPEFTSHWLPRELLYTYIEARMYTLGRGQSTYIHVKFINDQKLKILSIVIWHVHTDCTVLSVILPACNLWLFASKLASSFVCRQVCQRLLRSIRYWGTPAGCHRLTSGQRDSLPLPW